MRIAEVAGQREVFPRIAAAVLPRDDVLDVKANTCPQALAAPHYSQ